MQRFYLFVFLLAFGLVAGCGDSTPKPQDFGGEDGKGIAELVDRMNDESNTIPRLKAIFASGTSNTQKEANLYPLFSYTLKGKVSVNGDTATGTVSITKNDGSDPVDKEWTFVKESGQWKIKTAQMP
jgi:hypothetical protein